MDVKQHIKNSCKQLGQAALDIIPSEKLLKADIAKRQPFLDIISAKHYDVREMNWLQTWNVVRQAEIDVLWKLKDNSHWRFIDEDPMIHGSFLSDPTILQNKYIVTVAYNIKERWVKVIRGKVITVDTVANDRNLDDLQFRLRIFTSEGFVSIPYNKLVALHTLTINRNIKEKIVSGAKGKIQNTGDAFTTFVSRVRSNPLYLLFSPRNFSEEAKFRLAGFMGTETTDHGFIYYIFHPLNMTFRALHWLEQSVHKIIKTPNVPIFLDNKIDDVNAHLVPDISNGIIHNIYRRPISAILSAYYQNKIASGGFSKSDNEAFFKQSLGPSTPLTLIIGSTAFIMLYKWANEVNDEALVEEQKTLLRENHAHFFQLIFNDPFLRHIKHNYLRGNLSKQAATEEAYLFLQALDNYYLFLTLLLETYTTEEAMEMLTNDPSMAMLFFTLNHLTQQGPSLTKDFSMEKPAPKPISHHTQLELFELHQRLYRKRVLYQHLTSTHADLPLLLAHSKMAPLMDEILDDAYIKALLTLYQQGKLDQKRVTFLLLEDALNEEQFKRWEILKINRINPENPEEFASWESFRRQRMKLLYALPDEDPEHFFIKDCVPSQQESHSYLLDRPGGNLTKFHLLRKISPHLVRFKHVPLLAQALRVLGKNRYKDALTGTSRLITYRHSRSGIITPTGVKLGLVPETIALLGKMLIVFDIYIHLEQWNSLEEAVKTTGLGQDLFFDAASNEQLKTEVKHVFEQLQAIRRLTQPKGPIKTRPDSQSSLPNPYLN